MRTPDVNLTFVERLQRLFYMVNPYDSMFQDPDDVPNYVAESFLAFEALLVIEALLLWLQGKNLPRVPDIIGSVGAGMLSTIPALFGRGIYMVTYCWFWDNYRLYELPWDSIWTWLLCMIGFDFGYYWVHRCSHEINFMWAAHQVHHSSEDYNLSTALRQSVLQSYFSWVFYLPMALFIPPSIFLVHQQFNLLYQFWIHTEVVGWLGPLEYIINTPSAHRVHHGRNRYCIDKNYAATFIFFDILFGTYAAENREDKTHKVVYGLVHPIESRNPIYIQMCHWLYMFDIAIKQRKGVSNKILTFIYGPGWEPGKPRLGEITDLPDITYPQPKYEKETCLWYNIYALIHFLLLAVLNNMIHEQQSGMHVSLVYASITFILVTLTSLGSIFDQRSYGPVMEMIRCSMVTYYFWQNYSIFTPGLLIPIFIIFLFSSILFFILATRQTFATKQVIKLD